MKIVIQTDSHLYRIAGQTTPVDGVGIYQGRLLNELRIIKQLARVGNNPLTLLISMRNNDAHITSNVELWGASVSVESDSGYTWQGKITAYETDTNGVMNMVVTEKTAPELLVKFPDEVARLVALDANFHVSAVNVTLPIVVGGSVAEPILVKGILVDKTAGIYLLCVGEIHQIVKVYRGTQELSAGFVKYAGSAIQDNYPGFAYVQLTDEELRKNDDGSYVEISADVVGLKLGSHSIEECRNGARLLFWLLKTAREGVGGWGLGIAESDIDTAAFDQAIARVDAANLKLDGVFYFRQVAQGWIDQICQAIRGSYSIGSDGMRRLFVNAHDASRKTYTKANIKLLRHGKGAYTGQVYNKGRLEFGYNPLTSQFMQSAEFEDAASIANVDEQLFEGQSYLIRDMATAKALVDYVCKKSLLGANKIYFETKELPDNCREGDIITVTYPEKGIAGDWQINHLDIGDRKHRIEAEKFDASIFDVGAPGTVIDWLQDAPISSPVLPGDPSGLSLSTVIDYDSDGDGSARPFIEGVFVQPEGKYLGAAIFWGEGVEPAVWNSHGAIRGTSFRVGPVRSGQVYTVKVQLFSSSGVSTPITATITPGKHTDLPPIPAISVEPGFGCIVASIDVEAFTALAAFEIQRRRSDGSGLTIVVNNHRSTRLVDDSPEILTNYTLAYQYRVRAMSNSRQYSAWSDWSSSVSPEQVQSKDITDLPIIGKAFLTAADVGADVDGVKFTAAGIEMWEAGLLKVSVPTTGDPCFAGTISASSGYIGECIIADGGLRSADFVSQHRGWSINKAGDAEFNNLRARGAIESAVFRKDEVSAVGGKTLVRPAAVVEDYDYNAFLSEKAAASYSDYWTQLNSLLDESLATPVFDEPADYNDFYTTELDLWMQVSELLATGAFVTMLAEGDFSCPNQQAALASQWALINALLDESKSTPTFSCGSFTSYEQDERLGWMQANEILDYDVFKPAIDKNDTRLCLDHAADFAKGDIIRLKSGVSDYWGVVAATGPDRIDVDWRSGALFDITPGQAVINYGKAGSGGILLDGQSPLIDLFSHTGEPWAGTDLLVRQGNLKGWGGIHSDVYGLAIGEPGGDYILAIPGQGIFLNAKIQISGGSAAESSSRFDSNGKLIAATSPSGKGLYLGSDRLGFYDSGWKAYIDNDGNFALIGSGSHGLSWDASADMLNATGTIKVKQGGQVAAGITGNTSGDAAVRFWAGKSFSNRNTAPFRVLQDGSLFASAATISGTLSAGSGSTIAGFSVTTTDLTAGSGSNAVGISTLFGKQAFWAGSEESGGAPFRVEKDGTGRLGGFTFGSDGLYSSVEYLGVTFSTQLFNSLDESKNGLRNARYIDANNQSSVAMRNGGLSAHLKQAGGWNILTINGTNMLHVSMHNSAHTAIATNAKIYAAGSFFPASDEAVKSLIEPVDVLEKLKQLPVKRYVLDDRKIKLKEREKAIERSLLEGNKVVFDDLPKAPEEAELVNYRGKSIGLMAAEFNALFETGNGSDSYNLSDGVGVALRAIQELSEIVDRQAGEIAELKRQRCEEGYSQ